MTPMTERVEQCLARRRALGTGLSATAVPALRTFAAFAAEQGAQLPAAQLFLQWMDRYGSAGRKSWSCRLSHVRTFAVWLQSLEPDTEVPPAGLIPRLRSRPPPYIYTDKEIADLVRAASQLPSPTGRGLRGHTFSTLFGLLAAAGIRIGEALRLDDEDVDAGSAELIVRHAKNDATRIIPLAACTAERLQSYRELRDQVRRRAFLGVLSGGERSARLAQRGRAHLRACAARQPACAAGRRAGTGAERDRASATCGTASPSRQSSTGTGRASMSTGSCTN